MLLAIKRFLARCFPGLAFWLKRARLPDSEPPEFRKLKETLAGIPLYTGGQVTYAGWDLAYVDTSALISSVNQLIIKRWNDFVPANRCPVILDCGANIGISVLNYKRQFPGAKIVAFEPDPQVAQVLRRNLHTNGADDVTVIEAAVWTQDGETAFFPDGADSGTLIGGHAGSSRAMTVRTIDLASFISQPVDLLKMDIEGAEFAVVPHLRSKLPLVSSMVVECHLEHPKIGPLIELLHILDAAGFNVCMNTFGPWADLLRKPQKPPTGYAQYVLVAAWRDSAG